MDKNCAAVDAALPHLHEVHVPDGRHRRRRQAAGVAAEAPEFVRKVTSLMMAGEGDALPVSALPADGT